jgi:hypothetical protein
VLDHSTFVLLTVLFIVPSCVVTRAQLTPLNSTSLHATCNTAYNPITYYAVFIRAFSSQNINFFNTECLLDASKVVLEVRISPEGTGLPGCSPSYENKKKSWTRLYHMFCMVYPSAQISR